MRSVGVVVIGRNEGERLRHCLTSISPCLETGAVVYVDSGSTDGSVALANSLGVKVLELPLATPFTAARARNAGFECLLQLCPDLEAVQFVDGDCEFVPGWLDTAARELDAHPGVAVVCGRRRERHPEASVYNRLCDMEWNTPVGDAEACGGDALMRVAPFRQVGGFRAGLIAGEEPELCVRLRSAGWTIRRLDCDMVLHDADITRFRQWWRRAVRAGHAYAECSFVHRRGPLPLWHQETRSNWFWGLLLPLAVVASLPWAGTLALVPLVGYGVLAWRVTRHRGRRGDAAGHAWLYALFCVFGKFAHVAGQLRFHANRVLGRQAGLIEYKAQPDPEGDLRMSRIVLPTAHQAYLERKYLPELDGLRAFSAIIVVSCHLHDGQTMWRWLAGWQGVTVFFVLSGYLITTLSLREEALRGQLSLTSFYIRRSFRIFPLYYLLLGVYCFLILGLRMNPEKHYMLRQALPYYLLYFQEVPFIYGLANEQGEIQHYNIPFHQSWTLGIEEKFYLVWPLLAFVLWRNRQRVRAPGTLALAVCFALMPPLCAGTTEGEHLGEVLFPYYPILLGCLLGLLLHDRRWFDRLSFLAGQGWCVLCLAVFLALHFLCPWVPDNYKVVGYLRNVAYVLAVGAFLVPVVLGDGLIQRFLRSGPLVFLGRLSYAIYLVHVLCLNLAQKVFPPYTDRFEVSLAAYVLACLISVAVAWVLSVVVEKPCIEIGRRWSRRVLEQAPRPSPRVAV
jgi:peptidoglycan/LPS O-acetylase OafA/YrhL/glycosyltransferase involved in cell wall biosynthesis